MDSQKLLTWGENEAGAWQSPRGEDIVSVFPTNGVEMKILGEKTVQDG